MKTFLIFFLFFGIMLISSAKVLALTCPTGTELFNQPGGGQTCQPIYTPPKTTGPVPTGLEVECPAGTQPFNHPGGGTTCEPIPTLPQTSGQQQQQTSGQQPSQQKTQTTNVGIEIPNPLFTSDLVALIDKIATWLLGIGSTIAVIVVLWAAFLFMTSGGSKDQVTRARQTLWYAVIGLTVLLLAKGVTLFIQNVLSGRFS